MTLNSTHITNCVLTLITIVMILTACSSDNTAPFVSPATTGTTGTTGTGTTASTRLGAGVGTSFQEGALEIVSSTISTGGSTLISAYLVDSSGNLVTASNTVTFTSTCANSSLASFNNTSVTTTTGIASATYTDIACQGTDNIIVSATLDGTAVTALAGITISSTSTGSTTVRIGTGTGTGFTEGAANISTSSLSSGGSTLVSVNLVDTNGNLVTTSTAVSFSSTCTGNLTASFDNASVTTTTGTASAIYTASTCQGIDNITVSVSSGGTIVSATGQVTIAAPSLGSIQFTSNSSNTMALQGTGSSTGLPENVDVTFTVLNSSGQPMNGETVNFTINTTAGGITLVASSGVSDQNGEVVASLRSGTVATSVRVTAVVASNTAVATQSSAVAIATGPADQNSISLSVSTHNPNAWAYDGVQVTITARLADRFNNPIQDGTSISFTTELGSIQPFCSTVNGSCTVNWTSQDPRGISGPGSNAGRSTILATVEGEESFSDVNGNGIFDDGDIFTDIPEAYIDENESGTYDLGEIFIDYNNNGLRDAADGFYNGSGCGHSSLCSTNTAVTVRDYVIVLMAENNAVISGPTSLSTGGNTFTVYGLTNEQVLPAGTTVELLQSGNPNGTITSQSSYTIPSTTGSGTGATQFVFYMAPDITPSTGFLSLKVTAPDGIITSTPPLAFTD